MQFKHLSLLLQDQPEGGEEALGIGLRARPFRQDAIVVDEDGGGEVHDAGPGVGQAEGAEGQVSLLGRGQEGSWRGSIACGYVGA